MRFRTVSSPHVTRTPGVGAIMRQVLYALVPGTAALVWYFGWGTLINLGIAVAAAVGFEALMLVIRRRPVQPALSDYSAVVTAWLLAIAIPPLSPWWLTVLGVFFAIVVAKQLYGGLGYNPFNPAMVGYVVLLISFPREMTTWLPVQSLAAHHFDLLQTAQIIFTGTPLHGLGWDAVSGATPLDQVKTQLGLGHTISEIRKNSLFGDFGGKGWEWIANWYFLGGVWLLYKRIITWQIPTAMLLSLGLLAGVFFLYDPDAFASPAFHIFSGGAMLGAFFIATDPVTASTTPRGQLIYGAGIGILTFVIRTWGGYPDAIAFAVLLMNMAAPTIDYYTQPRVFGHGGRE
ncbi:MAG: electron transport complex subunit RsxD [Gammaproteobacteria bacterium]|jgi:electron transport complex protein RnfD